MYVYEIKVTIRYVSPMIWQHFRIHSDMSLGAFHFLLQFAFGWDNNLLHTFHINGKDYGISYESELGFYDNPWTIHLPHISLKIAISLLMCIIFIATGCWISALNRLN